MATTPAERKALMFVGAVAALGVGARVVAGARGDQPAIGAMQPALERQLAKAEGAARAERAKREERERAREGKGASKPRRRTTKGRAAGRDSVAAASPAIVDVDVADTLALATLPGVGPALARRIADDRRTRGAFGGIEALDAVPGVGPRLLAGLAGRVTFSGPRRPTNGMKQPARTGTRASSVPPDRRRRGPR